MRRAQTAQLACTKCCAPMDLLEGVPVLQSLMDHAVFECEWCGHIALVRKHEPPHTPCWSARFRGVRGVLRGAVGHGREHHFARAWPKYSTTSYSSLGYQFRFRARFRPRISQACRKSNFRSS